MTYATAIEDLIAAVPALRESYERELRWWGTERPGPSVIYEDLLGPHLRSLLEQADDAALHHVFGFIEELARAGDSQLRDLVAVAILEPLSSNPSLLSRARRYMGPSTKHVLAEVLR